MNLQLVIGLGNPGAAYETTRHNLGFRVVECLARRWGVAFSEPDPRFRVATAVTDAGSVVLLEPLTYMNRSDRALAAWSAWSGQLVAAAEDPGAGSDDDRTQDPPVTPLVVCDDLALPLGAVRIRSKGSAGGQKGLASIVRLLGSEHMPRVRLGVAPTGETVPTEDWSDYVLGEFNSQETELVEMIVRYAADAVEGVLVSGPAAAADSFNCRRIPGSSLPDDG